MKKIELSFLSKLHFIFSNGFITWCASANTTVYFLAEKLIHITDTADL